MEGLLEFDKLPNTIVREAVFAGWRASMDQRTQAFLMCKGIRKDAERSHVRLLEPGDQVIKRTGWSEEGKEPMMTSIRRFMLTATSLLLLLVLAACGSQAQTPPRSTTIAQSQRDVTYPGVGDVTLAGTLVIPAHKQGTRVPGVMIVAGSGPVDRNGNAAAAGVITNLYSQIADQLASLHLFMYNQAEDTKAELLLRYRNV